MTSRDIENVDVVIVGAGLAGASLATALANAGMTVSIFDSKPAPTWDIASYDSRVSAINLASQNIFMALGAWPEICEKRVSPFVGIEAWDERSKGKICFHATDNGLIRLGHVIENSVIATTLHGLLEKRNNAQVYFSTKIERLSFTSEKVVVTTSSGHSLQASLLVGADGAASKVRDFTDIDFIHHEYEQIAITAHVATEKSHEQLAYQRFLSKGPLALLPLSDGRCSIVWSANSQLAKDLNNLSDEAFIGHLEQSSEQRLGTIKSVTPRQEFTLTYGHAKRYFDNRIVLIGDAAHTIHPLAGLGANQGMLDAAMLAEMLIDSREKTNDLGDPMILHRYQRRRQADNGITLRTLNGLYRLFGNNSRLVVNIRGFGLDFTNQVIPIKRALVRKAAGLAGDLPDIARSNLSRH
ncbi:MAG: hypothetical protein CL398_02230 [Acidiferrobacteraceae bacterium]|nr:hypothetical protein [Acidiferrobacteraceae bacterium]